MTRKERVSDLVGSCQLEHAVAYLCGRAEEAARQALAKQHATPAALEKSRCRRQELLVMALGAAIQELTAAQAEAWTA
jgi:hypothetical protein